MQCAVASFAIRLSALPRDGDRSVSRHGCRAQASLPAEAKRGGISVAYADLREFIAQVEGLGALRRIEGADPRFEIGGITEVAAGLPECPALLFDHIKGFAAGSRIFTNATTNPQRAALALGIDPQLTPLEALKAWMAKRQTLTLHKPVKV